MGLLHLGVHFNARSFSLVYGVDTVIPIKVMVFSARLALTSEVIDPHGVIYDVEALKERRKRAENK